MRVGELFIELGLKGADATARGLEDTSKAVRDVASDALKAVAAISALFYGFRKIAGQSEQTGLGLQQFAEITGLSADQLQRWQQLAIRFGESAEQMTGDIKNVQSSMSETVLHGNYPKYVQAINTALLNAGKEGISAANARDTYGVMNKLREYAQLPSSQANKDIAGKFLSPLLSEKTIGAMFTSKFDLNKDFDKSRAYSSGQTKTLASLSIGWTEFFDRIEHDLGKLNVRFGPGILKELKAVLPAMERFVETLAETAEQLHIIESMGDVFTNLTAVLKSLARILGYTNTHTPLDAAGGILKHLKGTEISDKFNEMVFGDVSQAKIDKLVSVLERLTGLSNTQIHVEVSGVEGSASAIGAAVAQAIGQLPSGGASNGH